MCKLFNIDLVRDPIGTFYRSLDRAQYRLRLGLVLAGIALSLPILIGAAAAADMPMKAAPAAPVFNWTGCYVGINGGGAASGSDFTSSVDPGTHLIDPGDLAIAGATGTGSANDAGFIGGGQVGCNLQTGGFVFGIEGDWDYFRSNPTFTSPNGVLGTGDTVTGTQSLRTNSLATIRPRLGVATDRNVIYATGGVAFARVNYTQSYADTLNAAFGSAAGSTTLIGWTVGGGWEWAWTDHVSIKTEYLFSKFPTIGARGGVADNAGGTNSLHGTSDLTIQTARLGLNYGF
jgi:outer membrane immunogenic protein